MDVTVRVVVDAAVAVDVTLGTIALTAELPEVSRHATVYVVGSDVKGIPLMLVAVATPMFGVTRVGEVTGAAGMAVPASL